MTDQKLRQSVTRFRVTLQEVVFPSGRYAAVAVDLGRVVQNVGRLVQEKVRKECSCVVSGSAKCRT